MPLERHIATFGDQVEVLATMDVGEVWDRMLGEYLGEYTRLERTGIGAAEMEREMAAFMANLSDKPEIDLARTSSAVSYNQGRAAEILTAQEDRGVEYVVRSEIMDRNTCEACQMYDGAIFEVGSSDFQEYMPPAKCFGGDRCRGFYVAIAGEGTA